jgi:hypothetical protein
LELEGKKKAVVLDLRTHRRVWEDFYDVLRAKEAVDLLACKEKLE